MKKILFALLLGGLMVLALATVATADNGPHGNFAANTDACASCHRVHTAAYGSNSLLWTDPESLCLACHDGARAGTNVEDGIYDLTNNNPAGDEGTGGAPLFGGGFLNALMATNWSGKVTADTAYDAVSRPTTSHHDLGTTGTVWGSGANNSTAGLYVLECTSCHDPHGTAGWDTSSVPPAEDVKVASYRLLRWQPQGSDGFTAPPTAVNWSGGAFPMSDPPGTTAGTTGWTVPDNFAVNGQEWYTLGTTGAFAFGDYSAGNGNNVYNVKNTTAPAGLSYIPAAIDTAFFCAQCHDRYFNNSRLRNATDASVYCGAPTAGVVVNGVTLTVYPPTATGQHPVDSVRCEPVYTGGTITGWGDNGPSGDSLYKYRHASGDVRVSMDGTVAAGGRTSISRSCMACHVAHGTAATMTALAEDDQTHDSALLRMDNRSICLRCHANTVNFVVGP